MSFLRPRRAIYPIATLVLGAAVAGGQPSDPPPAAATEPASVGPAGQTADPPTSRPTRLTPEQKLDQTLRFLESEYGKRIVSPDWTTRGLGVICLARLPGDSPTKKLFTTCESDKHDVVRLLAWEALLARAADFDAAAAERFQTATLNLADRNAFNGDLRVALLHVLAAGRPTPKAKKAWEKVFVETNAWESGDMPVLDALGQCLNAWHSGALAGSLIGMLADGNTNVSAEYVLRAAGAPVASAYDQLPAEIKNPLSPTRRHGNSADVWRQQQAQFAAWLRKGQADWKEITKPTGTPWKELTPQYVPAPAARDAIDVDDPVWRKDLELGRPDLHELEAVFAVDATGSMGDVLNWLKRDVVRLMGALTVVCKEPPKIGVTFYRDFDCSFVTRHLGMNQNLGALLPELDKMDADGGGDIPEAVREGLTDAFKNNPWSKSKGRTKAIILVGDAPPHENSVDDCLKLARQCGEAGVKIHAVKCTTTDSNDLTTFDSISKESGGTSIPVTFPVLSRNKYIGRTGKPDPIPMVARPECQLLVAPPPGGEGAGERVLLQLLRDAVSEKYRDRMEPFSHTLLAYIDRTPPEKRLPFPANTDPLMKTTYKSQ